MPVVGGLGVDARGVVPSLGIRGNTGRPALASGIGDGPCSGIASQFRAGS